MDYPLLQLYSRDMGFEFQLHPGQTKDYELFVEQLPLAPGRYLVNAWLGAGKLPIDWHSECMVLEVSPGGLVNNHVVEANNYPVVISSRWQARE